MLELGCGTGRVLVEIARAGVEIVGVDLSEEMLARAEERLAAEPAEVRERVRLIHGDLRTVTVDGGIGRFALVTSPFRVVQHLIGRDDQKAWLRTVARPPGATERADRGEPGRRAGLRRLPARLRSDRREPGRGRAVALRRHPADRPGDRPHRPPRLPRPPHPRGPDLRRHLRVAGRRARRHSRTERSVEYDRPLVHPRRAREPPGARRLRSPRRLGRLRRHPLRRRLGRPGGPGPAGRLRRPPPGRLKRSPAPSDFPVCRKGVSSRGQKIRLSTSFS